MNAPDALYETIIRIENLHMFSDRLKIDHDGQVNHDHYQHYNSEVVVKISLALTLS
jgi:hypothetical protein